MNFFRWTARYCGMQPNHGKRFHFRIILISLVYKKFRGLSQWLWQKTLSLRRLSRLEQFYNTDESRYRKSQLSTKKWYLKLSRAIKRLIKRFFPITAGVTEESRTKTSLLQWHSAQCMSKKSIKADISFWNFTWTKLKWWKN